MRILLLSLIFFSCVNHSDDKVENITFEKLFREFDIHSAKQTKDNGFIIVGTNSNYKLQISKLDEMGEEEWVTSQNLNAKLSTIIVSDSNYIVSTNGSFNFELQKDVFHLLKMDNKGNVLWNIEVIGYLSYNSLIEQNDKLYTIYQYNNTIYMLEVSQDGQILNSSKLISEFYLHDIAFSFVDNQNIILTGSTTSTEFSKAFVCKIDLNGNIKWEQYINPQNSFNTAYGTSHVQTNNNNTLFLINNANYGSLGVYESNIGLAIINSNGKIVDNVLYLSDVESRGYFINKVGDNYFFTGDILQFRNVDFFRTIMMVNIDETGKINFQNNYNISDNGIWSSRRFIDGSSDGGYYMLGSSATYTLLLKTNKKGKI